VTNLAVSRLSKCLSRVMISEFIESVRCCQSSFTHHNINGGVPGESGRSRILRALRGCPCTYHRADSPKNREQTCRNPKRDFDLRRIPSTEIRRIWSCLAGLTVKNTVCFTMRSFCAALSYCLTQLSLYVRIPMAECAFITPQ